jgi:uncharacterized protein YndB with AHSA1/START domain
MKITVEARIAAPIAEVWRAWTTPEDICQWNAASADWHTTRASVDLRGGGSFSSRMEAVDGSMGFDFAGIYTQVIEHRLIEFAMSQADAIDAPDTRRVQVEFVAGENDVLVRETFDAEGTFTPEQQRQGWQAILDNFARHVTRAR